jgi:hypothetical protein
MVTLFPRSAEDNAAIVGLGLQSSRRLRKKIFLLQCNNPGNDVRMAGGSGSQVRDGQIHRHSGSLSPL